jgi:hypothetical protein
MSMPMEIKCPVCGSVSTILEGYGDRLLGASRPWAPS